MNLRRYPLTYIFLINALGDYLGDRAKGRPSLAHYLSVDHGAGPMWFVAALLAFSLAYALLRSLHAPPAARRRSGAQVMTAAAVLIAVTAFLTWQRWPLDDTSAFLNVRWGLWAPRSRAVRPRGMGG